MKLLGQFGIILGITFIGEALHTLIPLPIPASIYGLLIMLLCLCTKAIKLEQVQTAANFLVEIMPPMFIPASVGIIAVWTDLRPILTPAAVIMAASTVIVMVCTGRVSQAVIRAKEKEEAKS